jgi:phosphocarrier protein FPr
MSRVRFLAPLSGHVWALERVPDPVFAQKMVGDGLSIDPTDALLVSPCEGEVVSLHAAGHAVTLRTQEGIELLMHVGIDTVMLRGEGFIPRVKAGDKVQAGAPLIQFDLDFLATHAKSLLTQIVIANSERITSWERASGLVSAGRDALFTGPGAPCAPLAFSRPCAIPMRHAKRTRTLPRLAARQTLRVSTHVQKLGCAS